MKEPTCPLCQIQMKPEYIGVPNARGRMVAVLQEERVQIWVHNPKNLHEDIQVPVHKACYDKIKALYPDFDMPTEKDWKNPKIPTIDENGNTALTDLSKAVK